MVVGLRTRLARFALTAMLLALSGQSALAGYATVLDNGPSGNRVNIAFLGDGYLASDLATTYVDHVDAMLSYLFNAGQEPFARYGKFFNAYRIDVVSNERGASAPPLGIYRDTALGSSYYFDNETERLLYFREFLAEPYLDKSILRDNIIPQIMLVTVNDTRYGGGGAQYAVYAGGNAASVKIAAHEIGHSFAGLADEYDYDSSGQPGGLYTGAEPSQPNVTTDPAGAKWAAWIGYNDPQLGVIGAYQGGMCYSQGIYRPSLTSRMRVLDQPYDAISREMIIRSIYSFVRPMDSHTPDDATLVDPAKLSVSVVDPAVIDVDWSVNGTPVSLNSGATFDLRSLGYQAGTFTVTARAYDPTDWVRMDRSLLEQSVNWTVQLFLPGDANEDGMVSFKDYVLLEAGFGKSGTWRSGDFNGDGTVSFADYILLEGNFGQSVPEPGCAVLLLLAPLLSKRGMFLAGRHRLSRTRRGSTYGTRLDGRPM